MNGPAPGAPSSGNPAPGTPAGAPSSGNHAVRRKTMGRGPQLAIALLLIAIAAMGLYLLHLRRKAASMVAGPAVQALEPPPSGPEQPMTLYVGSDEDGSMQAVDISSAQPADAAGRARLALQTLITRYQQPGSTHPLPAGPAIEEVYLLDASSAVVNLDGQFAAHHPSGIQSGELTLFSMVLTLKAQLPQLSRVRFLVDGGSQETLAGHIGLAGWFDVGQVASASSAVAGSTAAGSLATPSQAAVTEGDAPGSVAGYTSKSRVGAKSSSGWEISQQTSQQ